MPPVALTRAHLHDWFESLPISAFAGSDVSDPVAFLPRLFGAQVGVEATFECEQLGSWVNGWTVIARLPGTVGLVGFHLGQGPGDNVAWGVLSRGRRINRLSNAMLAGVWCAPTLSDLAHDIATRDPEEWLLRGEDDRPGWLNSMPEVWLLRQAQQMMTPEERAAHDMVVRLSLESDLSKGLQRHVQAAGHIAGYHSEGSDAGVLPLIEQAITDTADRLYGAALSGYHIERTGIGGVLLTHPQEAWPAVAERLLEAAHEAGDLPSECYARSDSVAAPDHGKRPNGPQGPKGPKGSRWCIAA